MLRKRNNIRFLTLACPLMVIHFSLSDNELGLQCTFKRIHRMQVLVDNVA